MTARPSDFPALIHEITRKIVAGYAPQKIVLFGSYARRDQDEDSDVDLLIIKDTDKPAIERWMEVKRLLRDRRRKTPISPLVLTPSELAHRLSLKDPFIRDILDHGEVLYG